MLKTFGLVKGQLVESAADQTVVLLYIAPDEQEKNRLVNEYLLDEYALASALDEEEPGRLEIEQGHVAAIIKRPRHYSQDFLFKVSSVGLFLFKGKLIVVMDEDPAWDKERFVGMNMVQDIFLRVIWDSTLRFEKHLSIIRKVSDGLEEAINQAFSNKDLLNMFKIEKSLVYYEDAINANNTVLEKLWANVEKVGFDKKGLGFLEDLAIESKQCYQQVDSYSQVLSSMMDARASIINNNLNVRIKTLTILSICIMVPTLVVSLFSMNVPLPIPQAGTLASFWFVFSLAVVSVITVLLFGFYKKL